MQRTYAAAGTAAARPPEHAISRAVLKRGGREGGKPTVLVQEEVEGLGAPGHEGAAHLVVQQLRAPQALQVPLHHPLPVELCMAPPQGLVGGWAAACACVGLLTWAEGSKASSENDAAKADFWRFQLLLRVHVTSGGVQECVWLNDSIGQLVAYSRQGRGRLTHLSFEAVYARPYLLTLDIMHCLR